MSLGDRRRKRLYLLISVQICTGEEGMSFTAKRES